MDSEFKNFSIEKTALKVPFGKFDKDKLSNELWGYHSFHCNNKNKGFIKIKQITFLQFKKITNITINKKIYDDLFHLKVNHSPTFILKIELKPILGDDYPVILRKMIKKKEDVLICQKFDSVNTSIKELKQYFLLNEKKVFLESEFLGEE